MILYYLKNDYSNIKEEAKKNGLSLSEFSEKMTFKALFDFNEKNKILSSDEINKIIIKRSEHGKPYFDFSDEINSNENPPEVHFSISHTSKYWSCLMSNDNVGLDIESFKKDVDFNKIANRFFHRDEQDYINKMGKEGFCQVWVRKEAYIKYLGIGFSKGLDSFSVADSENLRDGVAENKECLFRDFKLDEGIYGAIFGLKNNLDVLNFEKVIIE